MRRVGTLLAVLLGDLARHRLQAAVSIAGIAVGVAVVVAVQAAGVSARQAFTGTFLAVAGRATHQVTAAGGVDPSAVPRLRLVEGVEAVQPVIEGLLPVIGWSDGASRFRAPAGERPLCVVGLSPFRAAPFLPPLPGAAGDARTSDATALLSMQGAVLVPAGWAAWRGLDVGATVEVVSGSRVRPLAVVGLLDDRWRAGDAGAIAACDLAVADELLGTGGRLSRVDVIAREGADLGAALAAGERLERPATRGERGARMVDAFRLNLLALSSLALVVGAFLAFNAAQFTVVRRARLLGQLRSLGASRRALLPAVLAEAALLGLAGGLAGVAGGAALAGAVVDDVARTISTLYGFVQVDGARVGAGQAAAFVALATVVSVAAATWPAWEAAHAAPRRGSERCGLLLPSLAAGEVERSLSRAGAAAGSLAVALSMAIGLIVMVASFQREVLAWIDATLQADLYLSPVLQEQSRDSGRLPEPAIALARRVTAAEAVDLARGLEVPFGAGVVRVIGAHHESPERVGALVVLQGEGDDALPALARGEALVTEALARRHGVAAGDRITLPGRDGPLRLRVAAVFRDYALDRGYVLLGERAYLEAFGDTGVLNAALHLPRGVDLAQAAARLRRALATAPDGPWLVDVEPVASLRAEVKEIFGRTFAVTHALTAVATALALLGIATTLLALLLERRREVATLRALGAPLTTIGSLFALQGLLLSGLAALGALPAGALLAQLLCDVVNPRSFGWSILLHWPWLHWPWARLSALLAAALVAGLLAAPAPWLAARREGLASSLREE